MKFLSWVAAGILAGAIAGTIESIIDYKFRKPSNLSDDAVAGEV